MIRRQHPALAGLAGLLAIYLVAPFLAGLAQVGLADWIGADWAGLGQAAFISCASATLATALVALGGIPLAYALARAPGPAMRLLGFIVQLPLALPPLTSGILLLFLFGYASPIGRLTGGALTDSFIGIVLSEAFVAAPFLIIAARGAFIGVDPVLEDVAATLGHPPGAVFRRVSLSLAWRGIAAGLLLTWLRAFGEFGATVMVAYHPYSLPVFTYVAFGSAGLPAMLPVLLPTLVIAVAVMAASQFATAPPTRRPVPVTPALPSAPPAAPATAPPQTLDLAFRQSRDGFVLDVAWRTSARRLSILGASGSGKSATLRQIAGLDPAAFAALTLNGRDLAALPPHQRSIAYVPQNYGLFPHLTVAQQIRFGTTADPAQARHWTARLGLAALEHRYPGELSLGQQQRVALARALSQPARLILLDEPLSALDAPLRARLRDELAALQQEIDATTILVTHDPMEAIRLADDIMLLEDGHVLQTGPVDTVFRRPVNEAAARLLGADNIAAGWATTPNQIDLGGVAIATDSPPMGFGPVGLAIRPDCVRITADRGIPATLLRAEPYRGGQRRLLVQLGSAMLLGSADTAIPPGPCRVVIDPAALQIWPLAAAQAAPARAEPTMVP